MCVKMNHRILIGPCIGVCASDYTQPQQGVDDRNEPEPDGGSGGVLCRPRTGARLRRRDRRTVELRAARQSTECRRRGAQAEGVLRRRTCRPRCGPSRLRPLCGEAGAAGPATGRPDTRTRCGRGEGSGRRCVAHGGGRSGQPLLGPLPAGAGDQSARLRARGRGRGRSPDEA